MDGIAITQRLLNYTDTYSYESIEMDFSLECLTDGMSFIRLDNLIGFMFVCVAWNNAFFCNFRAFYARTLLEWIVEDNNIYFNPLIVYQFQSNKGI